MQNTQKKRELPFERRALRNPGKGLQEKIVDVVFEKILIWVVMGIVVVIFVAVEWIRWAINDGFRPLLYSLMAAGFLLYAVWKVRHAWKELANLKTGLAGELYAGHYLQNSLLRHGYWVVHDIPGNGFNIDHAVIGPGGVFSIETKTRTKWKSEDRITYDGTRVLVNGFQMDRNPVTQASAAARFLQRTLAEYARKTVPVKPVVLFPGWLVEPQLKDVDVWVLNEEAFPRFLQNEPQKLSREEIFVLAEALGRYVREKEQSEEEHS